MNTKQWVTWQDGFKQEAEERLNIDPAKLCKYGIQPLDDALCGIMRNELVVIGADSGAGKSEVGINIAQTNAKEGKKVALYFLEGGHIEAMARMKWRDITDEYYNNYTGEGIKMNYRKWRANQYTEKEKRILLKIESAVWIKHKEIYKNNLDIYHLTKGFTVEDLLSSLLEFYELKDAIQNNTATKGFSVELIVIDHLQYFDLTQGETEIMAITKILKEVKTITNMYGIPVVLISHLRKRTRDRGLPDQEDFYGSSNIPKIATTAIMIAPDRENFNLAREEYPTYFRICKSRTGINPNFAMRIVFDLKTRTYLDGYTLHKVNCMGAVCTEPLKCSELPEWARAEA